MISFDLQSLFTNVPLDDTIEIILRRIYVDKELNVPFSRKELKDLLLLCTRNVPFIFNSELS